MKMQFTVSEVELCYKTKIDLSNLPIIKKSEDSYNILLSYWDMGTIQLLESAKVLYLNRANKVIGIYHLSVGSDCGTVCSAKQIFAAALRLNASAIILAHNHPSGKLQPSKPDLSLTDTIKQGAKLLDMVLFDHLILTADSYYSMADNGDI